MPKKKEKKVKKCFILGENPHYVFTYYTYKYYLSPHLLEEGSQFINVLKNKV